MQCNQTGIDLIKSFEGCELTAYQDQNGIWTIGWGHTGPEVVSGLVWTQDQADAAFGVDLANDAETPINNLVNTDLTSNQYSALCSFVYNIGSGDFQGSSALALINSGDLKDVPQHILMWNKAGGAVDPGLVRRRNAEVRLWNTGV